MSLIIWVNLMIQYVRTQNGIDSIKWSDGDVSLFLDVRQGFSVNIVVISEKMKAKNGRVNPPTSVPISAPTASAISRWIRTSNIPCTNMASIEEPIL